MEEETDATDKWRSYNRRKWRRKFIPEEKLYQNKVENKFIQEDIGGKKIYTRKKKKKKVKKFIQEGIGEENLYHKQVEKKIYTRRKWKKKFKYKEKQICKRKMDMKIYNRRSWRRNLIQ